jgi:hypothetical protein
MNPIVDERIIRTLGNVFASQARSRLAVFRGKSRITSRAGPIWINVFFPF